MLQNSQGYMGEPINENSGTEINNSSVYEYSYLDGQVVHLSGNAGHGINNTQEIISLSTLIILSPNYLLKIPT